MFYRHPFLPRLRVCVLGEIRKNTGYYADAIFIEELQNRFIYNSKPSIYRVLCLHVQWGVAGDGQHDWLFHCRSRNCGLATAHWAHLIHMTSECVSTAAINEAGTPRVVYDISGKPPATIEE